MTLDEMKNRKKELGYSNQRIAEKSGVPLGTVQKIFAGQTKSPREETITALQAILEPKVSNYSYLNERNRPYLSTDTPSESYQYSYVKESSEHGSSNHLYHKADSQPHIVAESCSYGTKRKSYTVKDYLALPQERRVELIDGIFYDMSAPSVVHQIISGSIYKFFLDYVMAQDGDCLPLISPVDVQLDQDDKTMLQPDVIVVCDRSKINLQCIYGAPDLIIEVLSPSTGRKDRRLKLYKYGEAGVREYWMVDPDRKNIVVYDLEHDDIPAIYSFQDKVPVLIWNKKCVIDFAMIYQRISFLYQ